MNPADAAILCRAARGVRKRGLNGDTALAIWLEHEAYMVQTRDLDGTTEYALAVARAILGERAEVTT